MKIIESNSKLYIKYIDNNKGWGVFTKEKISKGEVVEECYYLLDEYETTVHKDYIFKASGKGVNFCSLILGFGSIYNHSYSPNIYSKQGDFYMRTMSFIALRDIEPEEELCHNYSEKWWKEWSERNNHIL